MATLTAQQKREFVEGCELCTAIGHGEPDITLSQQMTLCEAHEAMVRELMMKAHVTTGSAS